MGTVIAELVGFAVIVWVLYRFVRPPVRQMVRDRQDTVAQQVEASEEATRRLDAAHQRFESAEVEARKEVARLRDDARADASRIRAELQEQADQEMERIRQRGQEQLGAQRDQLARTLRAQIGGQAMRLAEQIVVDLLGDDTRKTATVDRFLGELDGMAERTGTQRERARADRPPVQREPAASAGGAS